MSLPVALRRCVAASALTALAIGFASTSPSLGAPAEGHGALTVLPSPSVAAQITVDGVARNQATIVDLPLVAGEHLVCLSAAPGYLPPPCEVVDILEGETTSIEPVSTRSGTLHVATEPTQSDAEISIDGTPRDSGDVRLGLAVGTHEVCFGAVTGMTTPPCEQIEIVADGTADVIGAYRQEAAEAEPAPEPEAGPVEQPTSLAVELTGSAESSGGNRPWSAVVTIGVRDAGGQPLAGTTVSGTWSTSRPPANVTSSCVTGSAGTCSVHARDMSTGSGNSATFVLDNVLADPDLGERSGHSSISVNRNGSVNVS